MGSPSSASQSPKSNLLSNSLHPSCLHIRPLLCIRKSVVSNPNFKHHLAVYVLSGVSPQFTSNLIKFFLCWKTFIGFYCSQNEIQNPYQFLKILIFFFSPFFPVLPDFIPFFFRSLHQGGAKSLCLNLFLPSGTYLTFNCSVSVFQVKMLYELTSFSWTTISVPMVCYRTELLP